jgi:hypothetical protein
LILKIYQNMGQKLGSNKWHWEGVDLDVSIVYMRG